MKFSQFKHQHQNLRLHQVAILMVAILMVAILMPLEVDSAVVVDSVGVEEEEEEARDRLDVITFSKKEKLLIFLMIHLFPL